MKVYMISGLGANEHAFDFIRLPEGFDPYIINWEKPEEGEALQHYALKLATHIREDEPYVLMGLSIGGMIATEIAKVKKPLATILVSSAASSDELPMFYRKAGWVGLHKMIPTVMYKSASFLKRYFVSEKPEAAAIIRSMIHQADPAFIKWGINAIVHWQNHDVPRSVFRIHGTKDEILPLKKDVQYRLVEGGRHLMILDRAKEVNQLISEILEEVSEM